MDTTQLRSAAAEHRYLRGLIQVPVGLLFIVAALGNEHWGPLDNDWVFLAVLVLLAGVAWADQPLLRRALRPRDPSPRTARRKAVGLALLGAALLFGLALLLRSRADWSLDLPVNPIPGVFGAADARLLRRRGDAAAAPRRHLGLAGRRRPAAGVERRRPEQRRARACAAWRSWSTASSTTSRSSARSGPATLRTDALTSELALDRLVHEPGRLAILTVLSSVNDADFLFLQRTTGLTKGNLSSHLAKLEDGGLVDDREALRAQEAEHAGRADRRRQAARRASLGAARATEAARRQLERGVRMPRLALDLTPLRHSRDLRLLMLGDFVTAIGTQAALVALPFQVYSLTHSAFLTGLLARSSSSR